MNLDEQYVTKEMKKLLEQSQKIVNSEIMQKRIQESRAGLEAGEKSGLTAQYEELKKQIKLVAPQFFPETKPEDIAHTKEKYSVRYKAPEPETPKDKRLRLLAEYRAFCREYHEEYDDFDYDTLWECADEMRVRTIQLEFDTFADAYGYAVKHFTVRNKPIKSIHSLRNAFDKEKHKATTPLKSVPDQYK